MKKKIILIVSAALLLLLLVLAIPAAAPIPLDEIKSYVITVDMRQDGTMDIKYHLEWTVLNDTREGALIWVQIGIPNSHADEIKRLSDNIAAVSNLSGDGSIVRVDFDRAYHAGETASFDFSIHQPYMYTLNKGAQTCSYSFTPGWFDEIEVKSLKILWNKANVATSNATGSEGEYLKWETSLGKGGRYKAKVTYPMGVFDISENMQARGSGIFVQVILWLMVGGYVVFKIFLATNLYKGGFGRSRAYGHWHHHHSCACAGCACACACAGGGRAGCSIKNFYGAGVPVHTLKDKLK